MIVACTIWISDVTEINKNYIDSEKYSFFSNRVMNIEDDRLYAAFCVKFTLILMNPLYFALLKNELKKKNWKNCKFKVFKNVKYDSDN